MTAQWKSSLLNKMTIQLCFLWIKLIKLAPSGTQVTPDMTPVPFAKLDAHLLIQIAMSSNNRVFSVASRVISSTQANLVPTTAGKLLCVSENWKWWESELEFDKLALDAKEQLGCH